MAGVEIELSELKERLAPVQVDDLQPLSGGASSFTYRGVIASNRRVVVKVAPVGVPPVLNRDVLRQARLIRALGPTPVPVPEVLWEDAGDPPNVPPLFVTSFVEGTSLEPLFDLDGDEEEAVVAERMRNAAKTMAALHSLKPDALGLTGEPLVEPGQEIDRWSRLIETVDPALAPGWQDVAEALRTDPQLPLGGAIVHGDFRLGNALAVGDRITAVVDWEIWSIGDPRVDLGWFLVVADPRTYRRPTRYAGSLPAPDELTEIYFSASGNDFPHLDWFRALACFKSASIWSSIVKHNRRRAAPDPGIEEIAASIPHMLQLAQEFLA